MSICDLCAGEGAPLNVFPDAHVCKQCGFVFVPERRDPEEIADDWAQIYQSGGYDPLWPGVQARLFYVSEWLDSNIGLSGKRVLDIGAGDGSFMSFCDDLDATCTGIEPSPDNIDKWRLPWTYHLGPWETADELPAVFDIATINWTLENCGDPIGMLRFAASRADYVVVSTGSRILVPFKKPMRHYFGKEKPDLHAFRFSRNSLARAMWRAGLAVEHENDWMDRDEMILVGRKTLSDQPKKDDFQEVQDFFAKWQKLWL